MLFCVCAAIFVVRPGYGLIVSENKVLYLTEVSGKPKPQIWRGRRAVAQSLLTNAVVIWGSSGGAALGRSGRSPGFPGTSGSSNRRAAAHKVI